MRLDVASQIRAERNRTKPMEKYTYPQVYAFSSNEAGIHAKGEALYAYKNKGARYGFAYGASGKSFAIPVEDRNGDPLSITDIEGYVRGFLAYAKSQYNRPFKITAIAEGIHSKQAIAPLFLGASHNCFFPKEWEVVLGDSVKYWEK